MTNYQRQKYINCERWSEEVTDKERHIAEMCDADVYIYWTDGPDGRVGVSEDKHLYRMIETEDNWRIYFYDMDFATWKLYSSSTAKDYQYHIKQFGKTVTFHIPTKDNPEFVYGTNSNGCLFRLAKE